MARMTESALYPPVKAFLEAQGYTVKGEIGAADVVAMRGEEPPIIVELKSGFSLSLLQQAVARLSITDDVYVAVPLPKGGARGKPLRANLAICRRLGIGVMTVRQGNGRVEVHSDPGPYAARKSKRKTKSLLREFSRRRGDPNAGGATRHGIVTSYRQDALACAAYLAEYGASAGAAVAKDTGVTTATRIMADNHYGWFSRVARGVYELTDDGRGGLADWSESFD